MKAQCATCPFRHDVADEFRELAPMLAASALTEASRICHNTGGNNAIHKKTGKPRRICRGARDLQLRFFFAIGFLESPTDEAWEKKWNEMQKRKQPGFNNMRGRKAQAAGSVDNQNKQAIG